MNFKQQLQLSDLQQLIPIQSILGNKECVITGINEIHKVKSGDITFVDHPKYYSKSLNSAATIILIDQKPEEFPEGKLVLIVDSPFDCYVKIVDTYRSISTFNEDEGKPQIGANTVIHKGAVIDNDVVIGDHCVIYPNVVIHSGTRIGNNVTIQANSTIGADAFYYKRKPEGYEKMLSCGSVILDDNVEIGSNCTIDKGVSGATRIGKGCKFDNLIHVGHGVVIGAHCLLAAQVIIGGKTTIGNNVTIWGQCAINKDLSIVDNVVLLGRTGVSRSLKKVGVYWGTPAQDAKKETLQLAYSRRLPELFQ